MKKKDTRQQIIKHATRLFKSQGYTRTSIKQITGAVGCTAPALYYFFPGGKIELLQVVVRSLNMDPEKMLSDLGAAQSLEELIGLINAHLPRLLEVVATDIRWLHKEANQLPKEEQAFIQDTILTTYEIILTEAKRFIPEEDGARSFAWMIFLIHDGYMEMFNYLKMGEHDLFTRSELNQAILDLFEQTTFNPELRR